MSVYLILNHDLSKTDLLSSLLVIYLTRIFLGSERKGGIRKKVTQFFEYLLCPNPVLSSLLGYPI